MIHHLISNDKVCEINILKVFSFVLSINVSIGDIENQVLLQHITCHSFNQIYFSYDQKRANVHLCSRKQRFKNHIYFSTFIKNYKIFNFMQYSIFNGNK